MHVYFCCRLKSADVNLITRVLQLKGWTRLIALFIFFFASYHSGSDTATVLSDTRTSSSFNRPPPVHVCQHTRLVFATIEHHTRHLESSAGPVRFPLTICPSVFKVAAANFLCTITLASKVDYVVRRRPIGGMRPDLQKLIYHTSSDHFSELDAPAVL